MTDDSQPPQFAAERLLEIKVGTFVLVALAVGVAVVLLLGRERHLLEERATLHAAFKDVEGLHEGAPVRLAGVNVGTVSRVSFAPELGNLLIQVDLEISRHALDRVRQDSVARVSSQGLLGDKIVEISVGTVSRPALQPGGSVTTAEATDLNHLVDQAGQILAQVRVVADNATVALGELLNPATVHDLHASLKSIRGLLHQAEVGPGLTHALFYDPYTGKQLEQLLAHADQLVAQAGTGVRHLDDLLAAVDPDGRQLLNNVSRAAKQLGGVAGDLRASRLIGRIEHAAADIEALTGSVRAGKGTLGAIIADPSIYEQLVTILGGISRSRVLKALVRFAISKSDDGAAAAVTGPEPSPRPR